MRDYPSVPNVFRVASSHSVNTDDVVYNDIKIANANLPAGQLLQKQKQRQQQQQQHTLQQNGNISGNQQSFVKVAISTASTTLASNHANVTAAATATSTSTATSSLGSTTSSSTTILKTFAIKNVNSDTLMHNHNLQQRHPHQQYKLTAHASIERPQYLRASQLYLQSPYATLPRNPNASQSSLSLHSVNGGSDINVATLLASPTPQSNHRHHNNSTQSNTNNRVNNNSLTTNNRTQQVATVSIAMATANNNNTSHNKQLAEHKGNNTNTNDSTMMGVINTISGSIPATGFPMDQLQKQHQHHQQQQQQQHTTMNSVNVNGRTVSVASDLNASMNNSCTNLSKLNGVQHHQLQLQQQHQQRQQQQQQQQQQQKLTSNAQQHDFRQTPTTVTPLSSTALDEFTPYRRTTTTHPYSAVERSNSNGYLWIITPVAASISVAIVIAALAGPQWLFTEEKLPNTNYNGTANFNVLDDGAFITRYTKSSLWIICSTAQGMETYSCIKIDYFSKDGYQPDPHDSASAIPYTVTKSCPFFLASGIVLLLSFIVFLIPTCSHQNNLYYFSAGIMFIVSGLLMLIGLIAYISILKAEIGSKLRPRSSLQPPMFKVTYGQSFFLFVFGFIATEFVGLLNIFLYISLQEVGYYSRLPCFSISNLQEKIKEGENRYKYPKNTYKSYKHEIEKKPTVERKRHQQNKKHQVRAQELELDTKKLLKNINHKDRTVATAKGRRDMANMLDLNAEAPYACRKHPNGMGSTMFLNELDRRYYFEKSSSAQNKCNLHSKNLAKSLNELYLDSTLPPPPPSTIRVGAGGQQLQQQQQRRHHPKIQTLPRPPQQFSDSPQEFPLTRSVSTTTEIYATENVSFPGNLGEKSTATKTPLQDLYNGSNSNSNTNTNNRRRNVATNTRYNGDNETQTNLGSAGPTLGHTKTALSQQLQQQQDIMYNKRQQQNYATSSRSSQQLDENRVKGVDSGGGGFGDGGGGNDDDENDEDGDGDNDVDADADEVQPQKLCGLKRSIRKTKDELFEEFCKRAGVRPKPKNIYFIENEDDNNDDGTAGSSGEAAMHHKTHKSKNNIRTNITSNNTHQQHNKRQSSSSSSSHAPGNVHGKLKELHGVGSSGNSLGTLESNRIYGDAIDVVDMDAGEGVDSTNIDDDVDLLMEGEDDEHGFKKLTENEDHLYVIDDNIHLMPQSAIRNGRRASMYVEPNHLRRLNSNLSLHALYAPRGASFQKSLYDLDTTNNDYIFPPASYAVGPHYMTRDGYGGSQNRLQHDYHHQQQQQQQQQQQHQQHSMYQSRTLPRSLMKRNAESQDSIASAGVMASATQLHNIYSASQQRLTTLMMQQQQQQQHQQQQQLQQQHQQNRYLTLSREQDVYSSQYGIHKSNEELNRHYMTQPIYIQQPPPPQMQYQQQHPSMTNTLKQPLVQWPAAIPSSPSNFSGSYHMYNPNPVAPTQSSNHPLLQRSLSGGGVGGGGVGVGVNTSGGPAKFQRAYAFDEQRRPSAIVGDAFDLDEMERERRRSHVSLFAGTLGVSGSPAVKTNVPVAAGVVPVGVVGNTLANNTGKNNREHYDMINGTAV